MGLTQILVALCLLCSVTAQEIQVTVSGTDLYMSTADSECFGGDHDPRWRVRVHTSTTANWVTWDVDQDNMPSGGYQGHTNPNMIVNQVRPTTQNLVMELDAWEEDTGVCGADEGDCNGYGGQISHLITSQPACANHEVEIIRNCDDPNYEWRAKVSYTYQWKFGADLKCANDPPTNSPTISPSKNPTTSPTTSEPTTQPSKNPSTIPTAAPSASPTTVPTASPTLRPTTPIPSATPTTSPTVTPEESDIMIFIGAGVGGGLLSLAFMVFLIRRGGNKSHDVKGLTPDELEAYNDLKGVTAVDAVPAPQTLGGRLRNSLAASKPTSELLDAPTLVMAYDFVAEQDDELSAAAGTTLMCLDQKEDWYVVRHPVTGETGIVPVSYIRPEL